MVIKRTAPESYEAGEAAGTLTEEGARLLDPDGNLVAGIPLCPPEGDAGTGMAATNTVAQRTGNVSAGTSIFFHGRAGKAASEGLSADRPCNYAGWKHGRYGACQ